jgi:MFS family permease
MSLTSSTQSPLPSQKLGYAWYVVALLLLAYTLSFIDRMILSLLVGPIRQDLGISDTQMSLLMGLAFAIFYSALGLPIGLAADRMNRKNLVVAGVAIWSLMTALCGLTRSYAILFLVRIGVGVGEASLSPASYSLLGDYFPREKLGRAVAVYSLGVPIGSGIALVLGSFVVKLVTQGPAVILPVLGQMEPWRLVFLIVGLPGLLVALLFYLTIREPARSLRTTAPVPGEFMSFLKLNRVAVTSHFLGMSLVAMVMYGATAWIPQFLHRTYGMSVASAGLWFGAAMAVCGSCGILSGGWLADWLYRRGHRDGHLRVIRINAIILTPLFIFMALTPSLNLSLATMVISMLVGTIHGGAAGSALQLIAPSHLRARLAALYFLVVTLLGLGIGPTAIALITDRVFGDDNALRYSIAIYTAVALPLSAIILSLGLKAFAQSVERAELSLSGAPVS